MIRVALTVLLLLNVALAGWFWHTFTEQNSRLARLEALADDRERMLGINNNPPGRLRQANRQERIAFLLASAGNLDESKRILSAVPIEEDEVMARLLIARPAANDRNEALDDILRFIAAIDPSRAVALLAGIEESGLKTRLARHVLAAWITTSPESAARWLTGDGAQLLDPSLIGEQLEAAGARWSSFAPEAAARFIDSRPADGDVQPTPASLALGEACLEWGRQNTAAALAWVQSLTATDPRQPYGMAGVLQGWTEQEPVGAAAFVRQALVTGISPGGGSLAVVVIRAWSAKDASAAANWTLTLPDPAIRQLAMREAAARWADVDIASAARWAGELTPGHARGGVWVGLANRWADSDPSRLEAWLEGLPSGRDRDEATAVYINRLSPADPEKALAWARTLSGSYYASEQVRNVLAQWEIRDTAAARNWAAVNGVPLPPLSGGR